MNQNERLATIERVDNAVAFSGEVMEKFGDYLQTFPGTKFREAGRGIELSGQILKGTVTAAQADFDPAEFV